MSGMCPKVGMVREGIRRKVGIVGDVLRTHDEIALNFWTPFARQETALGFGLDTFCDDGHPKRLAQADNGTHNGCRLVI